MNVDGKLNLLFVIAEWSPRDSRDKTVRVFDQCVIVLTFSQAIFRCRYYTSRYSRKNLFLGPTTTSLEAFDDRRQRLNQKFFFLINVNLFVLMIIRTAAVHPSVCPSSFGS